MWKYCTSTAVSALLILFPLSMAVHGAPAGSSEHQAAQEKQEPQRAEERREAVDDVIRADRLIGQSVRDPQDERIGRVDDLALLVDEGRLAYAVIAHGGVFGVGADHVAVPFEQLQHEPERGIVRLDGTRQDLERAGSIDPRGPWPTEVTAPGEQPMPTTGVAREHAVISVDRLIGMDVQNERGERLGNINDIALSRDGEIAYAVIAHGGFLGFGHTYVAVPFDRLKVDALQELVVLDVTQEQFEAARPFQYDERWPANVDWPFEAGTRY